MRSEVTVHWDASHDYRVDLDGAAPMAPDVARWWLDEQFTRLGCEPLRATGKVLTADKVLCVAQAAGPERLSDAKWLAEYARAASTALAKTVVRVDVPAMAVSY